MESLGCVEVVMMMEEGVLAGTRSKESWQVKGRYSFLAVHFGYLL